MNYLTPLLGQEAAKCLVLLVKQNCRHQLMQLFRKKAGVASYTSLPQLMFQIVDLRLHTVTKTNMICCSQIVLQQYVLSQNKTVHHHLEQGTP